jgi:hypothetical protein
MLSLSSALNPETRDLLVFAFDRSLGFDPSAAVAGIILKSDVTRELALTVYAALPLMVAVAFTLQLRDRSAVPDALLAFMAIALIGFPIYFLYPVAGPVYVFGALFPDHLPVLPSAVDVLPGAPRNGMPSLHFAWALALCFHARGTGFRARLGYGAFLWLTALAILGLGEHYLIDLVVALPLVLVALAACTPATNTYRHRAFAAGLAMLGAWLAWLTWGAAFFCRRRASALVADGADPVAGNAARRPAGSAGKAIKPTRPAFSGVRSNWSGSWGGKRQSASCVPTAPCVRSRP